MVRQHHQLSGHEFGQTPGDSERQGNLACCSPWNCKESNMIQQPKNNHPNVHSSAIYNSQTQKQPKMSIARRMHTVCVCVCIYTHTHTHVYTMEQYAAIKKNEMVLFAATQRQLEAGILSELSHREIEISHDMAYMWNLKYDTNGLIHKTKKGLQTQIINL